MNMNSVVPSFAVVPVAYVRGGRVEPVDDNWDAERCVLELDARFGPASLAGLDAFSHLEIVYVFDRVLEENIETGARHPRERADWPLVGIFAQRGKARPNRLGVSRCRLLRVEGTRLHVAGLDAIDGTPVLDIKPYMREFGPRGSVIQPAWTTELMAPYYTAAGATPGSRADEPRESARSVVDHYEQHLAGYYSWLFGGLSEQITANRMAFAQMVLPRTPERRALDLGCGSGFQAIPLAELGFDVTAVDLSPTLLSELASAARGLAVAPKQEDIVTFVESSAPDVYDLCVCMGDTISHLPARTEVSRLFAGISGVLRSGGALIVSFRDLSLELRGLDRFIPVRADAHAIATCFLEFLQDGVDVYDLLFRRRDDVWEFTHSVYRKLRLAKDWVIEALASANLEVTSVAQQRGIVTIQARRA